MDQAVSLKMRSKWKAALRQERGAQSEGRCHDDQEVLKERSKSKVEEQKGVERRERNNWSPKMAKKQLKRVRNLQHKKHQKKEKKINDLKKRGRIFLIELRRAGNK